MRHAHGFEEEGFDENLFVDRLAQEESCAGELFQKTLDDVRTHQFCEFGIDADFFRILFKHGLRIREQGAHEHAAEPAENLVEEQLQILAGISECVKRGDNLCAVVAENRPDEFLHLRGCGQAEQRECLRFGNFRRLAVCGSEEGDHLVEQ